MPALFVSTLYKKNVIVLQIVQKIKYISKVFYKARTSFLRPYICTPVCWCNGSCDHQLKVR